MRNDNLENQVNLFDYMPDDSSTKEAAYSRKLDVVKMNYEEAESVTWQELFSGFNKLHAITFSSGINFIYRLLDLFDSAEIIFGCENVISYTLQEILAYQNNLLIEMRKKAGNRKKELLDRIDTGSVHFYVARAKLSHEKIYLLEADDGRKRVIMGSANMSFHAFGGVQRENICYVDGDAAYDWYFDVFQSLKTDSSDEISKKALDVADLAENIDELPIAQTTKSMERFSF